MICLPILWVLLAHAVLGDPSGNASHLCGLVHREMTTLASLMSRPASKDLLRFPQPDLRNTIKLVHACLDAGLTVAIHEGQEFSQEFLSEYGDLLIMSETLGRLKSLFFAHPLKEILPIKIGLVLKTPLFSGSSTTLKDLVVQQSSETPIDQSTLAAVRRDAQIVSQQTKIRPQPDLRKLVNPVHFANLADHQQTYIANNFGIILPDFFREDVFQELRTEMQRLWQSDALVANCNLDGVNRMGGYVTDFESVAIDSDFGVSPRSSLYSVFSGSEEIRKLMSSIVQSPVFPADFPIELREYGPTSKGMPCHRDLQLYGTEKTDLEVVFSFDNERQCALRFWDAQGTKHDVVVPPNALTFVQANAVMHCAVCPMDNSHYRTILKMIYTGDYTKPPAFSSYADYGECSENAPNVLATRRQREKYGKIRNEKDREEL